MITPHIPSSCLECPFARHLERNRFACGNSLTKVVKSHFLSTAECRDAIIEACTLSHNDRSDKFVQLSPLPDFRGLNLEWIANHIKLTLNWLDIHEWVIPDGEILIEVSINDFRIGYIKKSQERYYSERLFGVKSLDAYWIALNMVHPHYLDGVIDKLITERGSMPDYI
jgi:hypothetical protein